MATTGRNFQLVRFGSKVTQTWKAITISKSQHQEVCLALPLLASSGTWSGFRITTQAPILSIWRNPQSEPMSGRFGRTFSFFVFCLVSIYIEDLQYRQQMAPYTYIHLAHIDKFVTSIVPLAASLGDGLNYFEYMKWPLATFSSLDLTITPK
jgi:hypothetical protein